MIEQVPPNSWETTHYVAEDLQELDEQVKSMMENSQNMIQDGKQRRRAKICKVCGKEGISISIKDHIEAKHLEGVSIPCNNCEKTFRSRVAKRMHKCKNDTLGNKIYCIMYVYFRTRQILRNHKSSKHANAIL